MDDHITPPFERAENWAGRAANHLATLLNWIIGSMMGVMCAVTAWQVFARYVLNDASSWSEEVARIMMTWMVMLGCASVLNSGGHITVTVGIDRMGPKMRSIALWIRDLAMLLTLVAATWAGFQFARLNAVQLSAALSIPLSWIYAALWIGAALMIVMLVLVRLRHRSSDWTADADGFE